MSGPRIAVLDIETSPAVVEAWGLHKQYINIQQVREPGSVLGFAVKWHGARKVEWFGADKLAPFDLALAAHDYLSAADIVVTYNGNSFDLPILRREIFLAELDPPAPFKSVDLYRIIRHNFRFLSGKLDFVAQQLGIGAKIQTGGYELWQRCMAGDAKAWAEMARYCKGDVNLTDDLFERLLPWITDFPNVSLWSDDQSEVPSCPRCGSFDLRREGIAHALAWSYQRYQCKSCGAWARGTRVERKATSDTRAIR